MEHISIESGSSSSFDNFQGMDSKHAEVLRAAKSLFSKRTRTLYHWMYPSTPKAQLKNKVSMSWETLGPQEKEFYVSQVLGRFGFPQSSLMVNPQLDCLRPGPQILQHIIPVSEPSAPIVKKVVERKNIQENNWAHKAPIAPKISKKKGRIGRPPGSKNKSYAKIIEDNVLPQIQLDKNGDDFQDDPELNQEFEQFKWTLHLTDSGFSKK